MNDHQDAPYDQENDLPFNGPSEWYPYRCRACDYKERVEDVFIDAFPPNGPAIAPSCTV